MILRRIAFFVALVGAALAVQLPEFAEQYRQRLGGAIDALAAVVARFDSDSAQQGLTEAGGVDRLRTNADALVRLRGDAMAADIGRLQVLRDAQAQFRSEGPVARLGTLVTHYDATVARGALGDFEPALPTTPEALALGMVGFLLGGGIVHVAGRPLRRRIRETRTA